MKRWDRKSEAEY